MRTYHWLPQLFNGSLPIFVHPVPDLDLIRSEVKIWIRRSRIDNDIVCIIIMIVGCMKIGRNFGGTPSIFDPLPSKNK